MGKEIEDLILEDYRFSAFNDTSFVSSKKAFTKPSDSFKNGPLKNQDAVISLVAQDVDPSLQSVNENANQKLMSLKLLTNLGQNCPPLSTTSNAEDVEVRGRVSFHADRQNGFLDPHNAMNEKLMKGSTFTTRQSTKNEASGLRNVGVTFSMNPSVVDPMYTTPQRDSNKRKNSIDHDIFLESKRILLGVETISSEEDPNPETQSPSYKLIKDRLRDLEITVCF